MALTRRRLLAGFGAGGLAVYLRPAAAKAPATHPTSLRDVSPVDRTLPDHAAASFYGDDPTVAHKVFRDIAAVVAALPGGVLPAPQEDVPLVVVGGGLSGLVAAYELATHQPIVLEQGARFGGNSQAQSWHGIEYSIGAAYFCVPDPGSRIESFLEEIDAGDLWKKKKGTDSVALGEQIFDHFWEGETDPAAVAQAQALADHFLNVWNEVDGPYPDIPVEDPSLRAGLDALDAVDFRTHLEKIAGGPLHPHVRTMLEHYCWSSFGGAVSEISAACGLNFYAAEFGPLAVCPGGNAAVAERVLERVAARVLPDRLRTRSLVFDVRVEGDRVHVAYVDDAGAVKVVAARAAVLACPKFVVKRVLQGIEPARFEAISKLQYRSYLVANVCISGETERFYDLYLLGDGTTESDIADAATKQGATDVVLATFAQKSKGELVLTLYQGFPYGDAREQLYAPDAFEHYRKAFDDQIRAQILPLLGLDPSGISDLRIARWGHPLPLARTGQIAAGLPEVLTAPFAGRVFFVEQDNWALPAFETALTEAFRWAPEVEKVLRG